MKNLHVFATCGYFALRSQESMQAFKLPFVRNDLKRGERRIVNKTADTSRVIEREPWCSIHWRSTFNLSSQTTLTGAVPGRARVDAAAVQGRVIKWGIFHDTSNNCDSARVISGRWKDQHSCWAWAWLAVTTWLLGVSLRLKISCRLADCHLTSGLSPLMSQRWPSGPRKGVFSHWNRSSIPRKWTFSSIPSHTHLCVFPPWKLSVSVGQLCFLTWQRKDQELNTSSQDKNQTISF